MSKIDSIVELKADIDSAKAEISKLEGRKEALMAELKKDWKCTTLKQADDKTKSMGGDLEKIRKQKEEGIVKLEEKYEL